MSESGGLDFQFKPNIYTFWLCCDQLPEIQVNGSGGKTLHIPSGLFWLVIGQVPGAV
jgi:hypothetical protein